MPIQPSCPVAARYSSQYWLPSGSASRSARVPECPASGESVMVRRGSVVDYWDGEL